MKLLLVCVAVLATVSLSEGRWRGHRKEILEKFDHLPNSVAFHRGKKQHPLAGSDKEHHHMKGMKPSKHCKIECAKHEICLAHHSDGTEKCVNKHNYKEGRRLFRKYRQRKEFLKGDIKGSKLDLKEDLLTAEHVQEAYDLATDYKTKPAHQDANRKHRKIQSIHDSKKRKHEGHGHREGKKLTGGNCSPNEMYEIRKRLTGWFVMLHTKSRQQHHEQVNKLDAKELTMARGKGSLKERKHHGRFRRSTGDIETETHGHCKCTKSVMWEFRKLDVDEDHHLSHHETANMEQNPREPCMVPFLKACDRDQDNRLSKMEWCCCLADVIAPCAEKTWNIKLSGVVGVWEPSCDSEGFYEREQCRDNHCWCVDLNGNEVKETRVEGKANCGRYDPTGQLIKM